MIPLSVIPLSGALCNGTVYSIYILQSNFSENLESLESEFSYWMDNHMITFDFKGENFTMARYNCTSNGPRPESYVEDFEVSFSLCLYVCLSVFLSMCLFVCWTYMGRASQWPATTVPRTDPGLNLMWRILRLVFLSACLSVCLSVCVCVCLSGFSFRLCVCLREVL